MSPVKAVTIAVDGVAQVDGSADWDGGSADGTPIQYVRGCLHHIIAAGWTGKQKSEIGVDDVWH